MKIYSLIAWLIHEIDTNPEDFEVSDGWHDCLTHVPSQYRFSTDEDFERLSSPFRLDFSLVDRWRFRRAVKRWKATKAVKDMQNPKPPESEVGEDSHDTDI